MNQTLRRFCLSTLFLSASCFASAQAKKIVLDKFEERPITKFQDGTDITTQDAKDGLQIHVLKTLNLETLSFETDLQTFRSLTPLGDSTDTKLTHYKLPAFQGVPEIHLQMTRKEQGKTVSRKITIKLTEGGSSGQIGEKKIDSICNHANIKLQKKNCYGDLSYENCFGEDPKYYNKNTVTYIYDFNPDPRKRVIWKIKLDKFGTALEKPELVDISTESFSANQQLYVKIVNINRFMYDVAIGADKIHFVSEPSPLLSRLFIGDTTILSGLLDQVSNELNAQASDAKASLGTIAANIRCFFHRYNDLTNQVISIYNQCGSFPCCYEFGEEYTSLADDLLYIKLTMASTFENLIKQQQKDIATKTAQIKSCEATKDKLAANEKERKPIEDKAEEKRTVEEKAKLKELLSAKAELDKANEKCGKGQLESLQAEVDELQTSVKYFAALNDIQTKMLPSESDLRTMITFLKNAVAQNSYFVRGPIQLNANRLDLAITIRSKDSLFKALGLPVYVDTTMNYQLPIKAKAFVSFSAGSFVAPNKRTRNLIYSWQQVPNPGNIVLDTAKYVLTQSGLTAPPVGFSAFGNLDWKLSPSVGLGCSIGVGITLESKPRPAYLAGLSLLIGKERQFVFTGGLAAMQINRLSSNLQAIADQKIQYAKTTDITYYKEFKTGFFLSATYTPFTISKNK